MKSMWMGEEGVQGRQQSACSTLLHLQSTWNPLYGKGPRVPLVIHGGTGLPPATVQRLISLGGSKFNVSTELKHAPIDTTFNYIQEHRDEYNPGKIDASVKDESREKVAYWIDMLGSAGKTG